MYVYGGAREVDIIIVQEILCTSSQLWAKFVQEMLCTRSQLWAIERTGNTQYKEPSMGYTYRNHSYKQPSMGYKYRKHP